MVIFLKVQLPVSDTHFVIIVFYFWHNVLSVWSVALNSTSHRKSSALKRKSAIKGHQGHIYVVVETYRSRMRSK